MLLVVAIVSYVIITKRDDVLLQIQKLEKLKQDKKEELLIKVSFYNGTSLEKQEFAKTLIKNEPLLTGSNLEQIITNYKNAEENSIYKAFAYYISGNLDKALNILRYLLTSDINNFEKAKINSFIGNIYVNRTEPNLEKALTSLLEAKKGYKNLHRRDEVFLFQKGQLYLDFGIYYKKAGGLKKSLKFYNKSLEIFEDLNMMHDSKYDNMFGRINHNIYVLYVERGQLDLAFPFLQNALSYKNKKTVLNLDDSLILLNSINSAGYYYTQTKSFEEALGFLNKGLVMIVDFEENGIVDSRLDISKANIYTTISNVYTQQFYNSKLAEKNFIESALNYQKKAEIIYTGIINSGQNLDASILANIHYVLGVSKKNLDDYKGSENEFNLSIQIIKEYLKVPSSKKGKYSTQLANNYFALSQLYFDKLKKKKKAKYYAKKAIALYELNLDENNLLQKWINDAQYIIYNCN